MSSPLDASEVSGQYFFPRQVALPNPWLVSVAGGAQLACRWERVDPDLPTLIHFHGNGEVVADYLPQPLGMFVETGVNVLLAEYRGYGGSTGQPEAVAMLDDVQAVFDSLGVAPSRAIAFGRSIGSLYAAELAERNPDLAGLVLESGIADPFERFLLYSDLEAEAIDPDLLQEESRRHFNQKQKLARFRNPLLLMHTRDDTLIDVSHSERLLAWSGSEQKELVVFPRGGHNGIMRENLLGYFAALKRFIQTAVA